MYFVTANDSPYDKCCVWNTESMKLLLEIKRSSITTLLCVHPSNQCFITADAYGINVIASNTDMRQIIRHAGITAIALSKDGQLLAYGDSSGLITAMQLDSEMKLSFPTIMRVRQHSSLISCLRFTANNQLLSGGLDQLLNWWDPLTGKVLQCCEGARSAITCVAAANGPACLTGTGYRDGRALLWNLELGAIIRQTPNLGGSIRSVELVPATANAYIGLDDGQLVKWNITTNTITKWSNASPALIIRICVSPDETELLLTTTRQTLVMDPTTLSVIKEIPTGSVVAMDAFLPSSTTWRLNNSTKSGSYS